MKKTISIIAILILFMALPAWADMTLNIKLNFFGPAAGGKSGPGVTTSFYLKSIVQRNLQVPFSTADLKAELQKTFNMPSVSLLAEGDLVWRSGGEPSVMQIVQIDGREIALVLTPLPKPGVVNFKVGVVEESNKNNIKNILLDTEIVLPDGEVAMLGFRDAHENSYFIAFCVQGRDEKTNKNVIRLSASQAPRKITDVKPVYPEEALKNKIQAVVMGKLAIDTNGRVFQAEVISGHPLLNDAALTAVKQWVYEPYIVNGKAQAVAITFTVSFRLNEGTEKLNDGPDAAIRIEGSQRPKLITKVNPVYPPEALEKKIEGVVVLEAVADETGKVIATRMVKSPDQILAGAAIQAVKQWVYTPYFKDGKAKKVIFTVTVTFSLNNE
jgi:TonB family protein